MRILYIARHAPRDNQDELAIGYALEKLGHEVIRIEETQFGRETKKNFGADFLLFHHCVQQLDYILNYKYCPKVFWTFDLFDIDDESLRARMLNRQMWFNRCIDHITVGFCTDGDWVAKDTTGKLVHLMQGADERVVGFGEPTYDLPPILFTGARKHGIKRQEHIEHLERRWGDKFHVLGDSGPRGRKHGRDLANVFASVKIVVAPDGPSTDNYWSNRVYLTLGLGGFLLHPYCKNLTEQYEPDTELAYYSDREELDQKIDIYLKHPIYMEDMKKAGFKKTIDNHLYRHRCEKLIEIVKERL